jgi:ubiquinone/menaquinone biosynthesis C-methylase UbiE
MFKNKIAIYERYRPDYPDDLVQILKSKSLLKDNDIVAEFGCGTGKLTMLLLNNGNVVHGVEPEAEMTVFLQKKFARQSNFLLYNQSAETSNLPNKYFDVIISAQSFHLFNAEKAKNEFYRIIKQNGFILLVWYFIDNHSPIAKDICSLFYQYGTIQNQQKRQEISIDDLQKIFYPNIVSYQIINQFEQRFSNEEFINSMLSSSYSPTKNDPAYLNYVNTAQSIYDKYSTTENHIKYNFQIHLYSLQPKGSL